MGTKSSKLATVSIEEGPNWLDLPADILDIIIQKVAVSVVDSIRFGAVCRLWWKAMCTMISSSPSSSLISSPSPWLMFTTIRKKKINPEPREEVQNSCSCFGIEERYETYRFNNMPRNYIHSVRGSTRGWLVFYNEVRNLYIFNPCSRVQILLPPFRKVFESRAAVVTKAILLSDPSRTGNWRIVVSSPHRAPSLEGLAIYMHGNQNNNNNSASDPCWTGFGHQNYQDMILHNDEKLYALSLTDSGLGSVEVWDVHDDSKLPTKVASFTNTVD